MSQKWKKIAQHNYSELKIIFSVGVFPESERYSLFNDKKLKNQKVESENIWDICQNIYWFIFCLQTIDYSAKLIS